jgi:hypothetical protein
VYRRPGLACSAVAVEGAHTYELTSNPRPFVNGLLGVSFMVGGVVGSLVGGRGIAITTLSIAVGVLLIANAARIELCWPTRITVDDYGIVFNALTYDQLVQWSEVESVRVHLGRYGGAIDWKLAQHPPITTPATFENLHRLLVEVEDRAPQATVSSD